MNFHGWRYKRFHPAYGIGWLCAGILIGLGLSQIVYLPLHPAIVVVIALIAMLAVWRRRWYMIVLLCIVGTLFGVVRGSHTQLRLQVIESNVGKVVAIEGVVMDDPELSARGDTRMSLVSLVVGGHHIDGAIWLTARGDHTQIKRGDTIAVSGLAKSGFGPYRLTLSYPTIVWHRPAHDPMITFRDQFVSALRTTVVEPAASLGIGFVVGQKTALPTTLDEQLRIVGLTHLVVASGYNLTILVRAAKRLFEKRSKFLVVFSSSFMIVSFIAISGASPSMTRASIVAGLSILAWYYGRAFHPVLLLTYVAAVTAIINPLYLWSDIGWWLSFLAFAGVMIVAPLIGRVIAGERQLPSLFQIIIETVAAQLMTLPIILLVFGNLPVLSILANVVTAPLIPLTMLLTSIAGIGSMIIPSIAVVIGLPAEILLSYFIAIVRWLSAPTWAQQSLTISVDVMIGLYVVIAMIGVIVWRRTRLNFRSQTIVE